MAFPDSQSAFITRLDGFIGSHLAKYLKPRGWEVFGLDRTHASNSDTTLAIDINDTRSVSQILKEVQPTHIMHIAAHSHVMGDPLDFLRVNLLAAEALMEAIV